MSDSLRPHGLQPTRLCPWGSPGKNTGMGCHAVLQDIFTTKGLNLCLLCPLHWWVDSLLLSTSWEAWCLNNSEHCWITCNEWLDRCLQCQHVSSVKQGCRRSVLLTFVPPRPSTAALNKSWLSENTTWPARGHICCWHDQGLIALAVKRWELILLNLFFFFFQVGYPALQEYLALLGNLICDRGPQDTPSTLSI